VLLATGAVAASSSLDPKGFILLTVLHPPIDKDSATTVRLRPDLRLNVAGDMVERRSIIVVRDCPGAGVGIICRVDADRAAKRVTIPAQERV